MIDLNKFDIATLVPLKSSLLIFTQELKGNKVEFIFRRNISKFSALLRIVDM